MATKGYGRWGCSEPTRRHALQLPRVWYAARLLAKLRAPGRAVRRQLRRRLSKTTCGEWRPGQELGSLSSILVDRGMHTPSCDLPCMADRIMALRLALRASCHDTAAHLAETLFRDRHQLRPSARKRVFDDIVTSWVSTGNEQGLTELVQREADLLAPGTLRKLSTLYPGIRGALRDTPQLTHAPLTVSDAMLVARNLELGELESTAVVRLLQGQPWRHASSPELDLLLYSALRGSALEAAGVALARYFSWHALKGPTLNAGAEFPRDFHFARVPERRGPLVSIVMAAHRASETIIAAINSLLAQSHRPLEILVCDDRSEDGTLELLTRMFGSETRVRIFASDCRQGPYNIRNALLQHCRGEFVAFHDADDLSMPLRIERQVALLVRSRSAACYTDWLRVRTNGSVVFFWDDSAARLCLPSLMIARRALERVSAFRPARFGADLEHRWELECAFGKEAVARIREPLVLGRWAAGSLSRSSGSESLETGYRAPARRAYANVVGTRALLGPSRVPDAEIAQVLRDHQLLIAPSTVREFTQV